MEEVPDLNELLAGRSIKMEVVENANTYTISPNAVIETNILPSDPSCIINHFDSEADLEMMQSQVEILNSPTLIELEDMTSSQDSQVITPDIQQLENEDDVIVQLMDIRTRLFKLRETLERRIGSDLSDFEFWLQDSKMLESHKTLVDQCIRGEGVVQVNIQLKAQEKRINILDVLKPDDDCHVEGITLNDDLDLDKEEVSAKDPEEFINEEMVEMQDAQEETSEGEPSPTKETTDVATSFPKWMVDEQFKADCIRLKIPWDSSQWTVAHVRHWIMWAVRQFNLVGVKLSDWLISGAEMKTMTQIEFKKKCPHDPGQIFWTHFQLLRKCNYVAIIQNEDPNLVEPPPVVQTAIKKKPKLQEQVNVISHSEGHNVSAMPMRIEVGDEECLNPVIRSGNNGQVQLWQFLLELLTSAEHTMVIEWLGSEGEFRLCNPDMVARLWGIKKNKPAMNYEKLSRALRYYYDGDMIAKVHGQRFVYKFVCDLKQLIGYDAADLSRLVSQSALALQLSDNSRDTSMTTSHNLW